MEIYILGKMCIRDRTLHILPDNLLLAGIFIAACFISLSIGTSVGTVSYTHLPPYKSSEYGCQYECNRPNEPYAEKYKSSENPFPLAVLSAFDSDLSLIHISYG